MRGRDAADIAGALAAMDGRMYGNHGAKAAIEIALHDLAGRAAGKPVHALLGDKKRSRMPLLGVVGGGDLDGDLRDAEKKKAAGFTAYKIKVGIDTPENDAARTRAICKLLGTGLLISADANQGYSTEEAIALCARGRTAAASISSSSRSRPTILPAWRQWPRPRPRSRSAPTKASIRSPTSARHHERKAARGGSLKAIKLGGVAGGGRSRRRLCDRLGMSVNISCKTGESSVACAAALHVASVIPNIAWGLTLTHLGARARTSPRSRSRPRAATPTSIDRPGLGIDVDEDRVRRHRVTLPARNVA